MCAGSGYGERIGSILQDPLVRLAMQSDGVSEQEMSRLLHEVCLSLAAREQAGTLHQLPIFNTKKRRLRASGV